MSEEVALGQVTVADLQPGDRIRWHDGDVLTITEADRYRWLTVKEHPRSRFCWPLTQPVELLSADQDDDDAVREALHELTSEADR